MYKLLQHFRDLPIYKKIILTYILIIVFPLMLLGYLSNKFSTETIVEKTIVNSSEKLLLINRNLDSLIKSVEYYATNITLLINKDLENTDLAGMRPIDELNMQSRIERTFNNIIFSYPNISSAMFVSTGGIVFGSEYRPAESDGKILHSSVMQAIKESDVPGVWIDMQKRDYLVNRDRDEHILTLGKKIINIDNGKDLGSLVLNVTEASISSIYQGIKAGDTGKYLIINQKGLIVSSQLKNDILTPLNKDIYDLWKNNSKGGGEVITIDNKQVLTVCSEFPKLNWKLIGIIPLEELTRENEKITLLIVITGISCFVLFMAAALLLSKIIAKPIDQLSEFAVKVTNGEMDAGFPVRSKDEVGKLGESLNYMIARLKQLLDNIISEQKQKRSFELQLIQSQIKPHFLYNTLELISSLAKLKMTDEVVRTVKSLSCFYRIALSKGSDVIPIGKEIQNAKSYLEIVQTLYPVGIEYIFDIPGDINGYSILKLTIQPVIENAVNHGLKAANRSGLIRIGGCRSGNDIVITVADNGVGMSRETIENVFSGKYEDANKSFGLKSVHERIKLYFGEEYGVAINSEPGAGTTITIKIPAIEEGEKHDKGYIGG